MLSAGMPAEPVDPTGAASVPGAGIVAARFAHWRTAENARVFDALARHFAHLAEHPVLPLHFEYALTSNDRGRAAAERLSRHLPPRRRGPFRRRPRVLDVGSAYGGFLVAFAERGARVTGIERDERYVRLAVANLSEKGLDAELVLGDAADPHPAFRRKFDLILANDVLEHLSRLDPFLANLREWLAKGGVAYLEIPNGLHPPFVLRDGHHQLFGITLLEFAEASAYMRQHTPGGSYDTYNYLGPEEYERLFARHGLSFEILPETTAGLDPECVLRWLAEVREGLEAGLRTVPDDSRALVRERVEAYLTRAETAPRADEEERRRFVLAYGPGFWIALARAR